MGLTCSAGKTFTSKKLLFKNPTDLVSERLSRVYLEIGSRGPSPGNIGSRTLTGLDPKPVPVDG
jgi:hypothetical protein